MTPLPMSEDFKQWFSENALKPILAMSVSRKGKWKNSEKNQASASKFQSFLVYFHFLPKRFVLEEHCRIPPDERR